MEIARLADPDILLAGVARRIMEPVLLKQIIDKTGAMHSTVLRFGGPVGVSQILFRQRQRAINNLAHLWRIGVITTYLIRRKRDIRPSFLSLRRMAGWRSTQCFLWRG